MPTLDYISIYKELTKKDAIPSGEIFAKIFGSICGQLGVEALIDETEFYWRKTVDESEFYSGHTVCNYEKYFFTIEISPWGGTEMIDWESEEHRNAYGFR